MDINFPIDGKAVREINLMRYKGVPPSWDLVEQVIKKSKLKMMARFEYVFGLPRDTLTWYKNGYKGLPAKYWHIFYDFDTVFQKYDKLNKNKKPVLKKQSFLRSNKNIVDGIKKQHTVGR